MKRKRLFLALLCIMVLSGCKKFKDKSGGSEVNPEPPTDFRISEKINNDRMPISLPDLNTEEGIREYLVGNWYFDVKNVNDIVCEMNVDEDLNVELFFHNYYTGGEKGEYQGKIKLSRKFANPDQAPDLISKVYLKNWETKVTSKNEPNKHFKGVFHYEKNNLETGDGRNKDSILWESRLYNINYELSIIIPLYAH